LVGLRRRKASAVNEHRHCQFSTGSRMSDTSASATRLGSSLHSSHLSVLRRVNLELPRTQLRPGRGLTAECGSRTVGFAWPTPHYAKEVAAWSQRPAQSNPGSSPLHTGTGIVWINMIYGDLTGARYAFAIDLANHRQTNMAD
jgi:hypothetical protein